MFPSQHKLSGNNDLIRLIYCICANISVYSSNIKHFFLISKLKCQISLQPYSPYRVFHCLFQCCIAAVDLLLTLICCIHPTCHTYYGFTSKRQWRKMPAASALPSHGWLESTWHRLWKSSQRDARKRPVDMTSCVVTAYAP